MSDPTRVLMLGDTHGNLQFMQQAIAYAVGQNCTHVCQLGDNGFLFNPGAGTHKLDQVDRRLEAAGLQMWWLPGNHENYTLIGQLLAKHNAALLWPEPVEWTPNITFLPRGARWEWDGVRFGAVGGAVSIDKDRRVPGRSWWDAETITDEQEAQMVEWFTAEPVDVLLTHDAPSNPQLGEFLVRYSDVIGLPYKTEEASRRHRERLHRITVAADPQVVFHGHYHYRYTGRHPQTGAVVSGLGCDGQSGAWTVVETEGFRLRRLDSPDGG
jgi:hypothetical protein